MERYLSATERPDADAEDGPGVAGAESDVVRRCDSEDGTKGTRFRFMPAPKTRWSSRGRKYSSSSLGLFDAIVSGHWMVLVTGEMLDC